MDRQSVRHMVIFNLKHPKGSAEAERFLSLGESTLTTIPGVKQFKVFRQVSPKNEYDYGFSMDFDTQADYDAYSSHPVHDKFVQEHWIPEVVKFLEIDFALK